MKLLSALHIVPLSIGSFLPLSAGELNFENINFDKIENKQNIYEPKDKLDEYIIKGATYSTKFVPLMNNGAEGNDYTNLMANDGKRLLVDAGFDFVNSTVNTCLLYTSPSPRDSDTSRMPSSA